MAVIIQSRDLIATLQSGILTAPQIRHVYNSLDSGVTHKVWEALRDRLEADVSGCAATSYNFVRAMQGPALDMMQTGIAIQQKVRQDETARYVAIREKAQGLLDSLADSIWGPEHYDEVVKTKELYTPIGKRGQALTPRERTVTTTVPCTRPRGLNPASSIQVLAFFNIALGLPARYEVRKTAAGTIRTPTANDKALAKWATAKMKGPGVDPRDRTVPAVALAAPFVSLILTIRDADKMLGVLRTPLDPDGRMRCSYNVAGTENARWSSSKNVWGRGTNLQNITPTMRRMFCSDDGQRLYSTDLEQAESYVVAGCVWSCTGDRTYWNAILSGDLHTQVCRMAWPELAWTGDFKLDRAIADAAYPGLGMSYRDVAKRIGHGSNYEGSAYGIAMQVGIPVHVVEDFQARYFKAFPAIRKWHAWVKQQLRDHRYLDTPLGRRRWFFSRPDEPQTIREAIAFTPQSTVGELLNLILLKCWLRSKLPRSHPSHLPIQILLQNHDAFAFQAPNSIDPSVIIREVNSEFESAIIPLASGVVQGETATMTIPGEFVVGWNWAYADKGADQDQWNFKDGNPDGLSKWKGKDERRRRQTARTAPGDWFGGPLP